MPSPTYVALAKTVLTGTQATINFNSIPSTYTDLLLLISARSSAAGDLYDVIKIRFNGATTDTNLSGRIVYAQPTAVGSSSYSYAVIGNAGAGATTANTFSSLETYIPNYAGSTAKPISSTSVNEANTAADTQLDADASLFNSTTAISSITILLATGSFVSGSRFDLYGIKNS